MTSYNEGDREGDRETQAEALRYHGLDIYNVNAKNLSRDLLLEICELVEDIWASAGIKEFVECESCNIIYNKKDIFGGCSDELYRHTISEIMDTLGYKDIDCPSCGEKTKFLYRPNEYIEILQDKYKTSVITFLTLVRNETGKLIGFSEGYVDTLDNLLKKRDLGDHFRGVTDIVKQNIEKILGDTPPLLFLISAIGILEEHMSPFILLAILNIFIGGIPEEYDEIPGLMELQKGHILHKVSRGLGAQGSGVSFFRKGKTPEGIYESELLVFRAPIGNAKRNFGGGILRFLRGVKSKGF